MDQTLRASAAEAIVDKERKANQVLAAKLVTLKAQTAQELGALWIQIAQELSALHTRVAQGELMRSDLQDRLTELEISMS